MDTKNYSVYKNIMSIHPIIDKDYLSEILRLENKSIICVEVSEVMESNTALVVKAGVEILDNGNTYTKRLFIKTVKHNDAPNTYLEQSMEEVRFYQFLLSHPNADVPVPACYDVFVSESTNEFVIVLEDMSQHYTPPKPADLSDKNVWYSCAESLALFHSAFWNIPQTNKKQFTLADQEDAESEIYRNREYLNAFLKDFGNVFDNGTVEIFQHAMEINNELLRQQAQNASAHKNITICNGDSHIYNFLLPQKQESRPIMVDFQFWGDGYGVGDLAHLTRVDFPDEFKKNMQVLLIEHYHKTLLAHGITNYSWERCIDDYRRETASMVLIPVWQYCCFGLKYEEWVEDIKGLIHNYEYMECDELFRNK